MSADAITAWAELGRFAEAAGVELDERAGPEFDSEAVPGESDVSDYGVLLRAIERGQMTVSDDGVVVVEWKKPPMTGHGSMTLNPDDWPYAKAMLALAGEGASKLAKLNKYLELLSGSPSGMIAQFRNRIDCNLATHLSAFLASE